MQQGQSQIILNLPDLNMQGHPRQQILKLFDLLLLLEYSFLELGHRLSRIKSWALIFFLILCW